MILEDTKDNHAKLIAFQIFDAIEAKRQNNEHIILGLATGSTPILLYQELVRLHNEANLSFENVYTFNLDEYYGLNEQHCESYHYFMHHHLFDHIDIPKENIFIPSSEVEPIFLKDYCIGYEKAIQELGGIDIQILGIGRNGHIGFNEPGSSVASITRKVKLHDWTKRDAAPSFGGYDYVPTHAITMGMKTIMSAKQIYLMAFGENKKQAIKQAILGDITDELPASFLQHHDNVTYCVDFNIKN
tara:strand:- start:2205 stop:2936 length:732 start_codon:yes stop_codon:yes gene_type:complete